MRLKPTGLFATWALAVWEEFKKLYPDIDINNPYLVFKDIKNNKEVEKDKSDLAIKNLKILDESRYKQQEYLNEVQNILEKSVHGKVEDVEKNSWRTVVNEAFVSIACESEVISFVVR